MEKYYKFELNMKLLNTLVLILSAMMLGILFFLVYNKVVTYHGYFILTSYFLYLCIHELCHGIGYKFFIKDKKNIKYGAMLEKGVLYAMCQERISKKGIIISLLMPLIILTGLVMPFAIYFKIGDLIFLSGLNLIGAIGDIVMVHIIRKMPDDISYIDFDANIGMYLVSKHDLSKYENRSVKFITSAKYEDKLICKEIKKVHITKPSLIYFIMFLIIDIIQFL